MRQTSVGFTALKVFLVVALAFILLSVAFYLALFFVAAGIVYVVVRSVFRAITGRGRGAVAHDTIVIEPGHREDYVSGHEVLVLPPSGK